MFYPRQRVWLTVLLAMVVAGGIVWAQDDPAEVDPSNGPVVEAPNVSEEMPVEQPVMPSMAPEPVPVPAVEPPPPPQDVVEEPPAEEPAPMPTSPIRRSTRPSIAPARPGMPHSPVGGRPGMPPSPRNNAPAAVDENDKPLPPVTKAEDGSQDGSTPTEPITFDFQNAELYDVIKAISRLTGKNFDVDPNIGATTVTIITHNKIPPEMAYQVLESILESRGFSLVPTLNGNLIKVIATQDATQSPKLSVSHNTDAIPTSFDDFSTHIVAVQYADASELATALKILASKNARIDTYMPTNTLIITDTSDGLRRLFEFLKEVDIPGNETKMEIFTLEYTRAEVMQQQLEQVLLDTGTTGGKNPSTPSRVPIQATTSRAARPVPGAATNQVIGTREEVLRMVPDERLNSLIVMATSGMMEKVRDLVKRLDTPTPYEANNLHIYELLNADAEQVEQALQPLVGTAPRKSSSGGGKGGAAPAAPSSGGGGGASGSPDIQPFEQKVSVNRYDQTNSLLIVASPQDYKLLESFIARLDVPQRQVLVDAVVMDVTISNEYGVSVESGAISGNSGFGMTNTENLTELASSLATTADAANAIAAPSQAQLALGVLGLGKAGGMTTGLYDDITIDYNGQEVTVPFVPLLLQAVETMTDLEVLSEPSIVTVDNEEASIVVGKEVPFITQTSSNRNSTDNTNTNNNYSYGYGGYTRVERQEVGVKLKVTPQISEGDNVLLDLEIEISDTDAEQIGSVDILGPTTNKSLFTNKVLVKDGSTAVLAGLIRDSASRKRVQPPVLGDIPVIGWLFRNKSNSSSKRNLVVLVTPHIIKENIDLERATQDKVQDYHKANLDRMLETSFFKRVKTKADLRKHWRPTFDRSEALTGERGDSGEFGRGDIKR